ncbi:MAG: GntR family transcriptional regulator [Candidatus Latescibacterota bacterium]|nr:MAG: GntR family transcriptional regulator [Candidatus Latescibacterota bacterium]
MADFKPVKRQLLYRSVAEQVIRLIEEGHLKPGDRLPPERVLCEQLGVSRTSLREGLKALSLYGIIESRVGDGLYVKVGNPRAVIREGLKEVRKTMHELVEAREAIELFIGRLAVERATPEEVKALRDILEKMEEKAREGQSFAEEDAEFHMKLATCSHNQLLVVMMESILPFIMNWIYDREELIDPSEVVKLHTNIVEGIARRDLEGTETSLREHFRHMRRVIVEIKSSSNEAEF